jgi:hypothetical protein
MTERKLIKGVTINLGGEELILPPLNLEGLEECAEYLDKLFTAASTKDQVFCIGPLLHASLRRNYPDITLEHIKQVVELKDIAPLTQAFAEANGYRQAGEPAPGE